MPQNEVPGKTGTITSTGVKPGTSNEGLHQPNHGFGKSGKQYYGRPHFGKPKDPKPSDESHKGKDADVHVGGANDVSWYKHNPKYFEDVSALPFGNMLGFKLHLREDGTDIIRNWMNIRVPGIAVVTLAFTIGSSPVEGASIVNVAAKDQYSWVRHKNSGHANYEAADLMMYELAYANLLSYLGYMLRAYAVINFVTATNRYSQDALGQACGVKYHDLLKNQLALKTYIASFAARLTALCAPHDLPLFKKAFWMYTGVYKDSTSDRAQMYLFAPNDFKYWSPVDSQGGARTTLLSLNEALANGEVANTNIALISNYKTVDDFIAVGEFLLSRMMTDEDCGIISGDIRKAYDSLFSMDIVPEKYILKPEYNEEILWMIHNMKLVEGQVVDKDIIQDPSTGFIIQDLSTRFITQGKQDLYLCSFNNNMLIDSRNDVPTNDEVVTSTRLAPATSCTDIGPVSDDPTKEQYIASIVNCDIFVPVRFDVYSLDESSGTGVELHQVFGEIRNYVPSAANVAPVTNFDYAPVFIKCDDLSTSGTSAKAKGFICDFDNVTVVSNHVVAKIHEMALMSEFGVPVSGSF